MKEMRDREKLIKSTVLFGAVIVLLFAFIVYREGGTEKQVVINEVCAHNSGIVVQNNIGTGDYIEIYNPREKSINLEGYGLSDNRKMEDRFVFEDYELPAHSYAIIFAAGFKPDVDAHIFADFKVSDDDTIYLTDPEGKVIDFVKMVPTKSNIVYARMADGEDEWGTMLGSPWMSNEKARRVLVPGDVEKPLFSAESGIYEEPFYLRMEGADEIYYTLDGKEPTMESQRYTGAILIEDASVQENVWRSRTDFAVEPYDIPKEKVDKSVIVRAIAVNDDGETSEISTAVYWIGERFREKYEGYDIVSLVADPEDLFGERGIYVLGEENRIYQEAIKVGEEEKQIEPANYLKRGKSSECKAVVEIFENGKDKALSQEVGLRINGNASRLKPIKNFRITARKGYDGRDLLKYSAFLGQKEPKGILIRSGFGKNQWLAQMVKNRAVAVQNYRPCVLFLEGEYWGKYSIQEACTENYLENYYGVPQEQIILIGGSSTVNEWEEMYAVCEEKWGELEQNIADWCASGKDCYVEIEKSIDIQSYIDYMCIQMYIGNKDFTFTHNAGMWRSAANTGEQYRDGKWRWIMYDLDRTLEEASQNPFTEAVNMNGYKISEDPLFMTLMRSKVFRERFVKTFMEIADDNFSVERADTYLEELEKEYKVDFSSEKRFFEERRVHIFEYLKQQFPEEAYLLET